MSGESGRSALLRLVRRSSKPPIDEEAALCLRRRRPGADSAAQSARRGLRGRRENAARWGKRDEFKVCTGSQRECRVAMPETAGGEFVMNRSRGLVTRAVGGASISREAQRMLVECGGKIAAIVGGTEGAGRVQNRYRDLQKQSDRGKHPTETPPGPVLLSVPPLPRVP
jgi:hypothetical protein